MKQSLLKLGLLSFLAAALASMPMQLGAQSTNKPAADTKPAVEKKDVAKAEKSKSAHPFRGKLAKLDKVAKTIKVGESVYQITSETKIVKAGKPATLEDGVEGELVTGTVKPNEAGKLVASSVYWGGKSDKAPTKSSDKSAAKKADKK